MAYKHHGTSQSNYFQHTFIPIYIFRNIFTNLFRHHTVIPLQYFFKQWQGKRSSYSDWLQAGRAGNLMPVVARFSAPVQTGHRGTFGLLYNGYRASFRGVKWPGRGDDHAPPSRAEVKETVELYLYSSGPSWPVLEWTAPLPLFQTTCTNSKHRRYPTYHTENSRMFIINGAKITRVEIQRMHRTDEKSVQNSRREGQRLQYKRKNDMKM
jgi:hypothetical protein